MKILCVTTWNSILYKAYAHRFKKTYNWPFDLKVYNEDEDFFTLVPDCKKFVQRNSIKMNNLNKEERINEFWKDGVRFCYKVYAYTHAILNAKEYDGLIGIDADSVFYNPIDENWVKRNIHKDECMMTYLGRGEHYSECGFLYWNLKHPKTKDYALEMKKMYDEDLIYNEKEQHDSYIWDLVRKRFEKQYKIKNNDIGDGAAGHVQARSILGKKYDHTKGQKRKEQGFSNEFRRRSHE